MLACSHRGRQLVFFGLVIFLTGCASSQLKHPSSDQTPSVDNKVSSLLDRRNSLIAPELLHLDLEQLVNKVIDVHPEPFALISEQAFKKSINTVKQSIRYPLSRSEFYLRIAPLVKSLGDVHSFVELPKYLPQHLSQLEGGKNQSIGHMNSAPKLFPLAVLYEQKAIYIAADLSNKPTIPTGSVLKSVNGAPIEYLIKVMKELTVVETETGQRRKIQVDFPWLLAVMGYAKNQYEIGYSWQGDTHTQVVEGIVPVKKIDQQIGQDEDLLINQSKSHQSFYGFSQLTDKTALLWFNDFKESPEKFQQFLQQQFNFIGNRGTKNIIIDVRYNEGGLSQNIKSLLAHIIDKPVYWNRHGELNISRPLKKLHREETKQRRKVKYQWGLQWLPLEWTDLLLHQISWGDDGERIPVEFGQVEALSDLQPFNIAVLVNGYCYSACSSFVGTVKHYQLGEVIGETAGNFIEVQYAYPMKSQLSHSRMNLTLPTMKLVFNNKQNDRKAVVLGENKLISPDISILRSRQQMIEKQDIALTTAILRIESEKD